MTDRRTALSLAVGVLALALAAWAAGRARSLATSPLPAAEVASRALPAPIGRDGFWIGGWVGPPRALEDAATWRAHASDGLDVSMGPLEDKYRRADNLARLEFLDSLRGAPGAADVPFVFVRDDSLHPDETTRPGWEDRVAAVVRAYGGSPSLAGYFLADEPHPDDAPIWAPAARLLRALDPAHPAYVNFLPISREEAGIATARARWRDDVAAAVQAGGLGLFTFDAYPFPQTGGERPHYLATLREGARVSREIGVPFGAILQWTGHSDLKRVGLPEALYQATQAIAHGAAGITWFTWWTPNPDEDPYRWRGGAFTYGGVRTMRADTLAAVNARARALAAERGPGPMQTVHVGGKLPRGLDGSFHTRGALPADCPVAAVSGGPATLGWTLTAGPRRCVLANRDRSVERTFTVTSRDGTRRTYTIPPGDAVVF